MGETSLLVLQLKGRPPGWVPGVSRIGHKNLWGSVQNESGDPLLKIIKNFRLSQAQAPDLPGQGRDGRF